jgi:penicillin-binding protein 1A
MIERKWRLALAAAATLGAAVAAIFYAAIGAFTYLAPTLPSAEELRTRDRQAPLRVYTRSGALIAQIGEQLRVPLRYDQMPLQVREAFLAAEDDDFFSHGGIDYKGVARSFWVDVSTGDYSQGSSTITMQLARRLFLSPEKTLKRKAQEVFLTLRIEREFSKEEILSTYLNEMFFGQRAYGVAAAAEVYFGKSLPDLTVAEAAILAGTLQSPSAVNPISNPKRAVDRRSYVLRRMLKLGFIDEATEAAAQREPLQAREFTLAAEVEAPYVAEMARLELVKRFGDQAVNKGYRVVTTIDGRLQTAAVRAVRVGLLDFDRRHGYRGPVRRSKVAAGGDEARWQAELNTIPDIGNLKAAMVVSVAPKAARVYVRSHGMAQIEWDGISWAAGGRGDAASVLKVGDVVYVIADGNRAQLVQLPTIQGALVSLDPEDGALVALVGGFDYGLSKFNRATQANRQPGSGFKPFLYSAGLENGFTPVSIILDAPILTDDRGQEEVWRPRNSDGVFLGPMRLRDALVKSRNMVSIRILRAIGQEAATTYAGRFGFDAKQIPRNDTMAIGSMSATPLQVATAYATFANDGYKIDPYFIDRIEDIDGKVLYRAEPKRVCSECAAAVPMVDTATTTAPTNTAYCAVTHDTPLTLAEKLTAPRVISAANAWIMDGIMADVIRRGTAMRALVLGRSDISGKTGTTNEGRDTWFNGFNRALVATVWVGFDDFAPLGDSETGSSAAVPIWVNYMREALRGTPIRERARPDGVVSMRVVPGTGLLAIDGDTTATYEDLLADHLPPMATSIEAPANSSDGKNDIF